MGFQDTRSTNRRVRFGSWPCKNAHPRDVGEKPGPVRSQAAIAAISGLVPTMDFRKDNGLAPQSRDLISANLIAARRAFSISSACKDAICGLSKQNGDDNAKENAHCPSCCANFRINRAGGGCIRTPLQPSEEQIGGLGANAKQQCLCRTRLSCRVRF
jgi:hypothetical protein